MPVDLAFGLPRWLTSLLLLQVLDGLNAPVGMVRALSLFGRHSASALKHFLSGKLDQIAADRSI